MKKSPKILIGVAILFLVCSFPMFAKGESQSGIIAILIAAVLAFFALRKKKGAAANKATVSNETSVSAASSASGATASPSLPDIDGTVINYRYNHVQIKGGDHYDAAAAVVGGAVEFMPEPSNEYDANAVAIMQNGKKLGYFAKDSKLRDMFADFTARGDSVHAVVDSVSPQGATMLIGYYISRPSSIGEFQARGAKGKVFKLTGNRNADMQEMLSMTNEDEEVTVSYDYDKEKYIADGLGYFPASANDLLEGEHAAFVNNVDCDDEGKYSASVIVFGL